jgi:hypothetical protein
MSAFFVLTLFFGIPVIGFDTETENGKEQFSGFNGMRQRGPLMLVIEGNNYTSKLFKLAICFIQVMLSIAVVNRQNLILC